MFENLNEVRRANSSGPKGTRKAAFQMKVNAEKQTILFSAEQFAEMNIADNSLSQFVDVANNRVFLAVMPGNEGTFAKTNQRGTKGKKFKNSELIVNLTNHKYDMAAIGLVKIGDEDGKTLYQITGNGAQVMEQPVSDAVAPSIEAREPVGTDARPEVQAFEASADVPSDAVEQESPEQEPQQDVETESGTDVADDEAIEDALSGDVEKTSAEELEF